MKQTITLILIFIGFLSFAQPTQNGKTRDKIKTQKVAFITEQLELTSDEAQKFWPIYNQFEKESREIKSKYFRPLRKQLREDVKISDSESNKLLEQIVEGENKMHLAKQTFISNLKTAISANKIIKLKAVEEEFNRKLLGKLRNHRNRN